ncbi:MAG: hypothetical protein EBX41_05895 [Chitinophagia bacterium]|nr:hypothetical protein [Chitinophagia bacterium]
MVQCQGVVLQESIKIGLTQAISGLANGLAQNLQQKNTAQQVGKQGGEGMNQNVGSQGFSLTPQNKKPVEYNNWNTIDKTVFEVLGVKTDEVMHSKFLADLLNADANHGYGAQFLQKFIDLQVAKHAPTPFASELQEFEVAKSWAKTEESASSQQNGNLDSRIDIFITNAKGYPLIIENKIYAGDGWQQLQRYYDAFNGNVLLFYLTPDGRDPSGESKGKLKNGEQYINLSYKEDILAWVEACLTIAEGHKVLHATLRQYQHLIKTLTNQSIQNNMRNEIIAQITKDAKTLEAAQAIADAYWKTQELIIFPKLEEQLVKVAQELNLNLEGFNVNSLKPFTGFNFIHPDLDKDGVKIRFHFDAKEYKDFLYGTCYADPNAQTQKYFNQHYAEKLKTICTFTGKDTWWPGKNYFEHKDWGVKEYQMVLDGSMALKIKERVKYILEAFKRVDPERYKFEPQVLA